MGSHMEFAIQCRGLTRSFAGRRAVDQVDLEVPTCAVYGFVGRNGAGKTTTIRLLLGLLRPDSGSARIFGLDVQRQRRAAAAMIGAMVETPSHYDHLTGRENLDISGRLIGAPRGEIDRVLEVVELGHAARQRVGTYSLGMRQRLGIARALIGGPRLLILDEPANGLDPEGIRDMRTLIAGLAESQGVTVFVSSHLLSEVEQTATHIGLMHGGRLLMQAPVATLKAGRARTVRFQVDRPEALVALLAESGIDGRIERPGWVAVTGGSAEAAARDVAAINFLMVEQGLAVSGIEVAKPSLEEIFMAAVGQDPAAADIPPLRLAA